MVSVQYPLGLRATAGEYNEPAAVARNLFYIMTMRIYPLRALSFMTMPMRV